MPDSCACGADVAAWLNHLFNTSIVVSNLQRITNAQLLVREAEGAAAELEGAVNLGVRAIQPGTGRVSLDRLRDDCGLRPPDTIETDLRKASRLLRKLAQPVMIGLHMEDRPVPALQKSPEEARGEALEDLLTVLTLIEKAGIGGISGGLWQCKVIKEFGKE